MCDLTLSSKQKCVLVTVLFVTRFHSYKNWYNLKKNPKQKFWLECGTNITLPQVLPLTSFPVCVTGSLSTCEHDLQVAASGRPTQVFFKLLHLQTMCP